mmetsp:Transcript_23616/g.35894  ORF Transcript_23616/g.35894 Transcript_23616/m.35894 type:complete len:124 (+) Transcript_23616:100-471(+)
MKLLALFALVSASSTSAFVAPRPAAPQNSALQAAPTNIEKLTNAATVAAATITTAALASPLAAIAEDADEDYVYGAVSAPGGIGLAVGLGVVAILTAAVPVVLAPGEDAYNEMKERDSDKWGR